MADREKQADPTSTESAFSDLRGRQSVRATFKLSDHCIEAISIIAGQLGIKQKSLFDHLFSDHDMLSDIARRVSNARVDVANRVQKTFVISRGALICLEDAARSFNAPRDALIEMSVQRLLPIIIDERRRHTQRKTVIQQVRQHLQAGRELLKEAQKALGEEDPLTGRLASAMSGYESAFKHMAAFIEKSEGIESFRPDAFTQVEIVFEDEE